MWWDILTRELLSFRPSAHEAAFHSWSQYITAWFFPYRWTHLFNITIRSLKRLTPCVLITLILQLRRPALGGTLLCSKLEEGGMLLGGKRLKRTKYGMAVLFSHWEVSWIGRKLASLTFVTLSDSTMDTVRFLVLVQTYLRSNFLECTHTVIHT